MRAYTLPILPLRIRRVPELNRFILYLCSACGLRDACVVREGAGRKVPSGLRCLLPVWCSSTRACFPLLSPAVLPRRLVLTQDLSFSRWVAVGRVPQSAKLERAALRLRTPLDALQRARQAVGRLTYVLLPVSTLKAYERLTFTLGRDLVYDKMFEIPLSQTTEGNKARFFLFIKMSTD